MAYLEVKTRGEEKYAYFVKKFSLQGKRFVLRKYVGKATSMASKEAYLAKNMDSLVLEELAMRKPVWEKASNIAYSEKSIEAVEKKAILLNNLVESQNAKTILRTEFAKEFIYNSNNIEGSRIPKEKLVELFEKGNTSYKNKNEVIEVKNSIMAFDYLENDFTFNVRNVKHLYHLLTKGMLMENGQPYPRGFKKVANVVGNSATTAPENVKTELRQLLKWSQMHAKTMYPLQRAFEFHARYESIHPFLDGNGRTGRLIMNKILLQNHYPPVIVYKENKQAYFGAISAAQEGYKKKHFQFMLEQAEKTYDQMIKTLSQN